MGLYCLVSLVAKSERAIAVAWLVLRLSSLLGVMVLHRPCADVIQSIDADFSLSIVYLPLRFFLDLQVSVHLVNDIVCIFCETDSIGEFCHLSLVRSWTDRSSPVHLLLHECELLLKRIRVRRHPCLLLELALGLGRRVQDWRKWQLSCSS